MQAIQLVQRHQIDVPLHLVDREEVARDIEHRAAPGEPRTIDDARRRSGDWPRRVRPDAAELDERREQLTERLDAVEQTGGVAGGDCHALGRDRQLVTLVAG